MKFSSAIVGGFAGSVALTILHESVRKVNKDAPRMDKMGMEAIEKTLEKVNVEVPEEKDLFKITMAGDLISNALYYSLAGFGSKKQVLLRGGLLGLAAGFGAVYLPKPLGLDPAPSNRTTETKLLTVAWYLTGGLVAAFASKAMEGKSE
ncbi:MAG TPA: hypothetical protein VF623_03450 [Segetibacter sp.]|jgi:hypothetical protein